MTTGGLAATQIMDCDMALMSQMVSGPMSPLIYDATTPEALGDWSTFYTNLDAVNCPATSCVIMDTGCTNPYSGN